MTGKGEQDRELQFTPDAYTASQMAAGEQPATQQQAMAAVASMPLVALFVPARGEQFPTPFAGQRLPVYRVPGTGRVTLARPDALHSEEERREIGYLVGRTAEGQIAVMVRQ